MLAPAATIEEVRLRLMHKDVHYKTLQTQCTSGGTHMVGFGLPWLSVSAWQACYRDGHKCKEAMIDAICQEIAKARSTKAAEQNFAELNFGSPHGNYPPQGRPQDNPGSPHGNYPPQGRPQDNPGPHVAPPAAHQQQRPTLGSTQAAAPVVNAISERDLVGMKLGKKLGQGAFGTAFEVLLQSGRVECVKVISLKSIENDSALEMLRREITVMQKLRHSNIVQYLGYQIDGVNNSVNIFLELASGGTLNEFLKDKRPISVSEIRNWTLQMVKAVEYLHSKDIVHRDLKGANVLMSKDGWLKIADFGLSKSIDDVWCKSYGCQTVLGTPYWMAPEVITCETNGGYGKKSDIWSIGCTVVEMVTGNHPWPELKGLNLLTAMRKIADSTGHPAENAKGQHPQLMKFLEACFVRDPSNRPSAAQLLQHPFFSTVGT